MQTQQDWPATSEMGRVTAWGRGHLCHFHFGKEVWNGSSKNFKPNQAPPSRPDCQFESIFVPEKSVSAPTCSDLRLSLTSWVRPLITTIFPSVSCHQDNNHERIPSHHILENILGGRGHLYSTNEADGFTCSGKLHKRLKLLSVMSPVIGQHTNDAPSEITTSGNIWSETLVTFLPHPEVWIEVCGFLSSSVSKKNLPC